MGKTMSGVFKLLTIGALAMTSAPAVAGDAALGSISVLYAVTNAIVFAHNGSRTNAPSCATGGWAVAANTSAGQSQASVLLAAYAMRKRIAIQGTGTCSVWSDRETIGFFRIED